MNRGLLLLFFALLSLFIFAMHFFINDFFRLSFPFNQILEIHIFLFAISIATIYTTYIVNNKLPNYVGFSYLATVFIKMGISIVFLYPIISSENHDVSKEYILHFFSVFFIYLLSEVVFVSKILKSQ